MDWWMKLQIRFGRQFVMMRCSNDTEFRIKRAFQIAGRWYIKTANGVTFYLLTDETRIRAINKLDPGVITSHHMWFAITPLVEAYATMQPEEV